MRQDGPDGVRHCPGWPLETRRQGDRRHGAGRLDDDGYRARGFPEEPRTRSSAAASTAASTTSTPAAAKRSWRTPRCSRDAATRCTSATPGTSRRAGSRNGGRRKKLKEGLDEGMREAGPRLCRSVAHQSADRQPPAHPGGTGRRGRRARLGQEDRPRPLHRRLVPRPPHLKQLIETYPDQIEVDPDPVHGRDQGRDRRSRLWAAIQKHDVGWFGIKPFAGNSLFKGDSSPDSPHVEGRQRIARMALRYILCNPAITAPMPGLITPQQVDNVCLAVVERRVLDLEEQARAGPRDGSGLGESAGTLSVARRTGNTSDP